MYEKYGTKNKKSKHMLTYKFIACLMTIVMLANVGSTSVIAAEDGVLQNEDGSQDASEIGESNESNESESSVPGNDETESGGETGDNKNEESGDGNPGRVMELKTMNRKAMELKAMNPKAVIPRTIYLKVMIHQNVYVQSHV